MAKVYLITEEQMKSITGHICQMSKEIEDPRLQRKCSQVNNELAQLRRKEVQDD